MTAIELARFNNFSGRSSTLAPMPGARKKITDWIYGLWFLKGISPQPNPDKPEFENANLKMQSAKLWKTADQKQSINPLVIVFFDFLENILSILRRFLFFSY
jgi:hypothetical protein